MVIYYEYIGNAGVGIDFDSHICRVDTVCLIEKGEKSDVAIVQQQSH